MANLLSHFQNKPRIFPLSLLAPWKQQSSCLQHSFITASWRVFFSFLSHQHDVASRENLDLISILSRNHQKLFDQEIYEVTSGFSLKWSLAITDCLPHVLPVFCRFPTSSLNQKELRTSFLDSLQRGVQLPDNLLSVQVQEPMHPVIFVS